MISLQNRRKGSQFTLKTGKEFLLPKWIILNVIGFFLMEVCQRFVFNLLQSKTLVYAWIPITFMSLLSCVFIGLCQFLFMKLHFSNSFSIHWGTRAWLSFSLIFILNLTIFPDIVFPWLMTNIIHNPCSFTLAPITGIDIYCGKVIGSNIFISLLFGSILGICSGIILGYIQSGSIKIIKIKKEWFLNTLVSIWFSFIVNSAVVSVFDIKLSYRLFGLYTLSTLITAFAYGLGTWKPLIKTILEKNKIFDEESN